MSDESPQVLVIDDSEIALEGMLETLQLGMVPAIGMPSAIGATRAVLRHKIRVVVVDVNMPIVTGTNLVALFRNNTKLAGVKIVLVSGLPRAELLQMASACGADDVVAKDEVEDMLVSTVRRLLPKATRI